MRERVCVEREKCLVHLCHSSGWWWIKQEITPHVGLQPVIGTTCTLAQRRNIS